MRDESFWDKAMGWMCDNIFTPFLVIVMALCVVAAVLGAAYLGWSAVSPTPPEDKALETITGRYWGCTRSYVAHHPARPGILTKYGRMSDHAAYDSVECSQWSARLTDGSLAGGAVEDANYGN